MTRIGRVLAAAGITALLSGLSTTTQCTTQVTDARTPEDETKLRKTVQMDLGSTDAGALAAELAKQTGLMISVESAIATRKLVVSLGQLSAKNALDAICSLEGWQLTRVETGHYELIRPVCRPASRSEELPRLMQKALPVDWRAFLQAPDLTKRSLMEHTSTRAKNRLGQIESTLLDRIQAAVSTERLLRGPVKFMTLTEKQRSDLVLWLALNRMDDSVEIIHGDFSAYRMEPSRVFLRLEGGNALDLVDPAPGTPGFAFGTSIGP